MIDGLTFCWATAHFDEASKNEVLAVLKMIISFQCIQIFFFSDDFIW